jgi:hypothetical protein
MDSNQVLSDLFPTVFIPTSAVIAILFGIWLWQRVSSVSLTPGQSVFRSQNGREYLLEEEQRGDDEVGISSLVPVFETCADRCTPTTGRAEGGRYPRSYQ